MRFQNNDYGMLGRTIQGALRQAEQAMQSGRLSPLQSQQKNVQIFRVAPNNAATAAGRSPQQSGAGVLPDNAGLRPDSEVYREAPAVPAPGQGASGAVTGNAAGASSGSGTNAGTNTVANTGTTEAASAPVRSTAPDSYEKQLKLNFNEDNLLSGIIMAEVLGRPKCLRRGRW